MSRMTRRDFAKVAVASLGAVPAVSSLAMGTSPLPDRAEVQDATPLDAILRRIFQDNEFEVRTFGPARWLNGGAAYTTLEPSAAVDNARDVVRYDTAAGRREVIVSASRLIQPGDEAPLAIDDYAWSEDWRRLLIFTNSRRVWRENTRGDYWVLERGAEKLLKLGAGFPASTLMFAKLSPDASKAAYVHDSNLYVEDLASGAIKPLTTDGSARLINGTSDWVNEEELDIRDGFRWSPDGANIAFWQFDTKGVGDFPLIYNTGGPYDVVTGIPYPDYGVYPYIRHIAYPEAGTMNSAVRVGVVSVAGGPPRWMETLGDLREHYIATMDWAESPHEIVMQHLNRLQNVNEVLLADARNGKVRRVHRAHDRCWLGIYGKVQWIRGGAEFLWESEHSGWRRIYAISRDGKQSRLVTTGAFDVIQLLRADAGSEWVYYLASPENATQKYLFRSRLDGTSAPERLTPADEPGTHSYNICPSAEWAFHTHSTFDTPPLTNLVRLPAHHVQRTLEENAGLKARASVLISQPAEFFSVDIGKGVRLDGWMMKPPNFNPEEKYPLLLYVYGGPWVQTVLDEWGGKGMLFHRVVANEGYIVASIDNRGTPAPKGRAWRKFLFGDLGRPVAADQAAAVRALLRTRPYLDPARVAVWGWSEGGSTTLGLLFRYPELYRVGMSVAPVTDWRLYDTIYTERYMGLPQDNVEGYREGSAINFAEGLRGNLLVVHGSDDDNVHIQNTQLLINRMVQLGKQFDFMEYPGRTHSLSEGPGTVLHLRRLLARFLKQHVPATSGQRREAEAAAALQSRSHVS